MKLDHTRLLADLRRLAEFGGLGTGVHRPAFSAEDRAAREWLLGRMSEAGLDARIDGVGNVVGQMRTAARAVLIGSHSDTVPRGGWLDGSLGVVYGLEIARAWIEASRPPDVGIDVVSFSDEEATFSGMLGSRSFCGGLAEGELEAARNTAGRSLRDALTELGWAERPLARLDPARQLAYLEAHIEQGPRLEAEAKRIGVVTGIVGIRRVRVQFTGRNDHAGTTPMDLRRDAAAALIEFCHDLLAGLKRAGSDDSVWNLGRLAIEPGVANVVPGSAEVLIEYRDLSSSVLDRIEAEIQAVTDAADGRGGVTAVATPSLALPPAEMDPAIGDLLERAARGRNAPAMRMPSGAGHDAMVLSRHLPCGMLFIPSIGGRSHDVAEDSHEADILLGADVLADAVVGLAAQRAESIG